MAYDMPTNVYDKILGADTLQWILSWNPYMVGICGVCFCVAFRVRECFLAFIEKDDKNYIINKLNHNC